MGRVYRGTNQEGRPAALKVMLQAPEDQEAVERFVREGRAMASIPAHPHVLGVYGAGQDRGLLFLALELAEGGDLEQELAGGAIEPTAALEACIALAEALAHVHQAGVIHRDLKPANALRRRDGTLALADFGLARIQGARGLTETGEMLGTPLYMAPEQVMASKDVDGQADVWALGVILYRALSGTFPFQGSTATETMQLILEAEPEPLRAVGGGYREVLGRALAKDRAERYASAKDMAHGLAECLARGGAGSDEQLEATLRRALGLLIGVALVLALVSAGAWTYTTSRRRSAYAERVAGLEQRAGALAGDCLGRSGPPLARASLDALAAELEESAAAGVALRGGVAEFAPSLVRARTALARARWREALAGGRWDEAHTLSADDALEPSERVILAQALSQARGAPIDTASLEDISRGGGEFGAGARVLLAAECLERDPRRSLELSRDLPAEFAGLAAPELRLARALCAVDEDASAALGEVRPSLSPPEVAAVRARALGRLDLLLEPLPVLTNEQLHSGGAVLTAKTRWDFDLATRRLECLGQVRAGALAGTAVGARLVSRLHEAFRRGDSPANRDALFGFLRALRLAGIRVPRRQKIPQFVGVELRLQEDGQGALSLALQQAWIALDVPLGEDQLQGPGTGRAAELMREEREREGGGVGALPRYLELRIRSAGQHSREKAEELVAFLQEGGEALGPLNRADLLAKLAASLDLGREQRAAWAEEAVALDPDSPWTQSSRALCLAEAGREAEAREFAARAEKLEQEEQGTQHLGTRTSSLVARRLALTFACLGDVDQTNYFLKRVTTDGLGAQVLAEAQALLRAHKSKPVQGADPEKQ